MTTTNDFSEQAGRIKFEKDSVSLLIQGTRNFFSYYISRENQVGQRRECNDALGKSLDRFVY